MTVLVLLFSVVAISHAMETQRRINAEIERDRMHAMIANHQLGDNGITIDM